LCRRDFFSQTSLSNGKLDVEVLLVCDGKNVLKVLILDQVHTWKIQIRLKFGTLKPE